MRLVLLVSLVALALVAAKSAASCDDITSCHDCVKNNSCTWMGGKKCVPSQPVSTYRDTFHLSSSQVTKVDVKMNRASTCALFNKFESSLTSKGGPFSRRQTLDSNSFSQVCKWVSASCLTRTSAPCDAVLSGATNAAARMVLPATTRTSGFIAPDFLQDTNEGTLMRYMVRDSGRGVVTDLASCLSLPALIKGADRALKMIERMLSSMEYSTSNAMKRVHSADVLEDFLVKAASNFLSKPNESADMINSVQQLVEKYLIPAFKAKNNKASLPRMAEEIRLRLTSVIKALQVPKPLISGLFAATDSSFKADLWNLSRQALRIAKEVKAAEKAAAALPTISVSLDRIVPVLERFMHSDVPDEADKTRMAEALLVAISWADGGDRTEIISIVSDLSKKLNISAAIKVAATAEASFDEKYKSSIPEAKPSDMVTNFYVVGSLHGDKDAAAATLAMSGMVKFESRNMQILPTWSGGLHERLVVAGNFMGVGPDSHTIVEWLRGLQRMSGGRVIVLRGPTETAFLKQGSRRTFPSAVNGNVECGKDSEDTAFIHPAEQDVWSNARAPTSSVMAITTPSEHKFDLEMKGSIFGSFHGAVGKWLHSLMTAVILDSTAVVLAGRAPVRNFVREVRRIKDRRDLSNTEIAELAFTTASNSVGADVVYSCEDINDLRTALQTLLNGQEPMIFLSGRPSCVGRDRRGLGGVRRLCDTSAYNIDSVNSRYERWLYLGTREQHMDIPRSLGKKGKSRLEEIKYGGFATAGVQGTITTTILGLSVWSFFSHELVSPYPEFDSNDIHGLNAVETVSLQLEADLGRMDGSFDGRPRTYEKPQQPEIVSYDQALAEARAQLGLE